jgi:UDP-N-acetylmuramate: L-alanyl-gamma-D-glutamyl-meso-diaminopimelate ligase
MPQAIRELLLPGKTPVVVTGTHGKTTTSALLSWILLDSGRDPGFLVGGEMKNLGRGYRRGAGPLFVLEGDEYNAAFFDRGPKFLHYRPEHLWIGNIEFDHADLFVDVGAVEEAFQKVAAIVPEGGVVVYNADDPRVGEAVAAARAREVTVSLADPAADFSAREIRYHPGGTELTVVAKAGETARLASPLHGEHNVRNLLGAVGILRGLGVSFEEIARSLPRFEGVRRRMDVRGEHNGILVVDDFAHHPTAVAGTLQAARARWPGRRLWALFEPRSNTAGRRIFQDDYARAFASADALVIAPIFHAKRLAPETQLDRESLVRELAASGKPALAAESSEEIVAFVRREARPGDVLILMSSGAFGGLPETLLESLA